MIRTVSALSSRKNARSIHALHPVRKCLCAASLMAMAMSPMLSSAAALNSNKVDVTLQATVLETLAITVANPIVAFGTVTPGAVNAAPLGQQLAITSTWVLNAGRTVSLYAYFDSATAAMTGLLGDTIPTSSVVASFNGGASQTFTQTSPFTASATSATLYAVPITASNAVNLARLDTLALTLDLTSQKNLHADTYTGTLHLQAQAL